MSEHTAENDAPAERFPRVQGFCPTCGSESLFLGSGGFVSCSRRPCSRPWSPSEALGVTFPTRVTPPGETEEETAEWYDTHDAITGAVIPPGQTAPDGKVR